MTQQVKDLLSAWAEKYNSPEYFQEDPIAFPREFLSRGASLPDIEIAAVFSAHFAWGRRSMIVRDSQRLFDHMQWRPYDYVMSGDYRSDDTSIHRTIKWSEVACICARLRAYYSRHESLETLSVKEIREQIYSRKPDPLAPDKKINMLRRWMVRCDSRVDLGLWKNISPADLLIPLDVHVYTQASSLGLTDRRARDIRTARQITDAFREIWPDDPVKGDFALFGYGVTHNKEDINA